MDNECGWRATEERVRTVRPSVYKAPPKIFVDFRPANTKKAGKSLTSSTDCCIRGSFFGFTYYTKQVYNGSFLLSILLGKRLVICANTNRRGKLTIAFPLYPLNFNKTTRKGQLENDHWREEGSLRRNESLVCKGMQVRFMQASERWVRCAYSQWQ